MSSSDPFIRRVGRVDVFHWNPVRIDESADFGGLVGNFGDLIGPVLVDRMLPEPPLGVDSEAERRTLMSVGSVLHFAPRRSTVWGSGVNFKMRRRLAPGARELDVRAVRGPLTARTLLQAGAKVPPIFGDPALLLPRYLPELSTWARIDTEEALCVPNLNDLDDMRRDAELLGVRVMSPTVPFEHALRAIAASAFVIGSSLHAIAIADALGIPARFIASEREHPFKYRDYLAGSGRPLTRIAANIGEALDLGGHAPPEIDLDALAQSFPYDLWGHRRRTTSTVRFTEPVNVLDAWEQVLANSPPNTDAAEKHFVDVLLPRLIHLAEEAVAVSGSLTEQLVRQFDDLRHYRRAIVPHLQASALRPLDANIVRALDADAPALAIRAVWLREAGAHAIVRNVRMTSSSILASLIVRPGTLTNDVESIEVTLRSGVAQLCQCEIPVFEKYRDQWSLDLSFGAELRSADVSAEPLTMQVKLIARSGECTVLDALAAAPDAPVLALSRTGRVQELEPWTYERGVGQLVTLDEPNAEDAR
ncbi:polysaccharide pyruvyl transferase family protein [Microbacterium sp.]|uniref:polysaccharide pyruvyl transferase family protein n=1 Tax=Microbacterium sp. TaxID=51671 RepID=UPI003A913216